MSHVTSNRAHVTEHAPLEPHAVHVPLRCPLRPRGPASRDAAALREAAAIASSATPINDPLQRILEVARPLVPSDHLVLLRVSPDRTAVIVAAVGTAAVWRWLRAPVGESVVARVIDTGEPQSSPAVIVVPVILDGATIGVLETADEHGRRLTDRHVAVLREVADQCAIALTTARTGKP